MNRELIAIVNEAIPLNPRCAVERKKEIIRRLWLVEKIEEYVKKQLEQQFNAKVLDECNR